MPANRRERKKAATRQALAEAARRLFLARGFDEVTVAEIADAADTAVSTLFAHFPGGKEALVLGDGGERERALTAAVRERAPGISVVQALQEFLAGRGPFDDDPDPDHRRLAALVVRTPALRAHARILWTGCETSLTETIAEATGRGTDSLSVRLFARYVLEIPDVAGTEQNPAAALETAFAHLRRGWPELA
ncbi:TetR/AcrR family transcriptional regulator [Amycolatopsis jiangsuensis]|uniref:AcrR family transcriptional regulator n=1 Tax=Amycolatopsis jiangsuensis TaxID=1181879 RepID=A0A840IR70_9PSEU|nr:TetR family transcriptional regulator [Amycolatopsis jiangsuensis]MBB4683534.1 AcrR family transcriptional regulator [Amycolatopsis jiangsuensis]